MVTLFPGQVQCIFLRNTSSTDSGDKFPYDTSGFKDVPNSTYMFFHVPDDLRDLNVAAGQCVNHTIVQNVTFGEQGLPFGINLGSGKKNAAVRQGEESGWVMVAALLGVLGAMALL